MKGDRSLIPDHFSLIPGVVFRLSEISSNYIPPCLVVVAPNPENQDEIIVPDLAKSEIIYKGQEYEDVRNWLAEDEFRFINGREFNYAL